jgi:hypothetical protein
MRALPSLGKSGLTRWRKVAAVAAVFTTLCIAPASAISQNDLQDISLWVRNNTGQQITVNGWGLCGQTEWHVAGTGSGGVVNPNNEQWISLAVPANYLNHSCINIHSEELFVGPGHTHESPAYLHGKGTWVVDIQ